MDHPSSGYSVFPDFFSLIIATPAFFASFFRVCYPLNYTPHTFGSQTPLTSPLYVFARWLRNPRKPHSSRSKPDGPKLRPRHCGSPSFQQPLPSSRFGKRDHEITNPSHHLTAHQPHRPGGNNLKELSISLAWMRSPFPG